MKNQKYATIHVDIKVLFDNSFDEEFEAVEEVLKNVRTVYPDAKLKSTTIGWEKRCSTS